MLLTSSAVWDITNTQHYFGKIRGYGHDESAPTPGGMGADKYIMR